MNTDVAVPTAEVKQELLECNIMQIQQMYVTATVQGNYFLGKNTLHRKSVSHTFMFCIQSKAQADQFKRFGSSVMKGMDADVVRMMLHFNIIKSALVWRDGDDGRREFLEQLIGTKNEHEIGKLVSMGFLHFIPTRVLWAALALPTDLGNDCTGAVYELTPRKPYA